MHSQDASNSNNNEGEEEEDVEVGSGRVVSMKQKKKQKKTKGCLNGKECRGRLCTQRITESLQCHVLLLHILHLAAHED
jgi:hypothetical protein